MFLFLFSFSSSLYSFPSPAAFSAACFTNKTGVYNVYNKCLDEVRPLIVLSPSTHRFVPFHLFCFLFIGPRAHCFARLGLSFCARVFVFFHQTRLSPRHLVSLHQQLNTLFRLSCLAHRSCVPFAHACASHSPLSGQGGGASCGHACLPHRRRVCVHRGPFGL